MDRRLIISLLLFSCIWLAPVQSGVGTEKLWKDGKEAASSGQYEKALHIWESARDSTSSAGYRPDPRIGFDYIELVSRRKMKDYYRKATGMYYWGLSGSCSSKYREEVETELERIKPLITRKEYKQWHSYLDREPGRVCREISKFWKQIDPTISTQYNERLIEHWQRIAYARENFTRNRSTIYDADERANIYVKLGEPDRKKSGSLGFSQPLVRSWVNDIIDRQFRGGGSSVSSGSDSSGSAGDAVGTNSEASSAQQSMGALWARIELADRFTKQAELLHRYQHYEVWIYYEPLKNNDDNLVYVFGEDGDTGHFGLRRSLDEMIPDKAFRNRSAKGSLLRPGLLLQLMYYQQLMHMDNYFADAFSSLESRIMTTNGLHPRTSFSVKTQNEHKLGYIQTRAPEQKSKYVENIPDINLSLYQYRFLDETNTPFLATYLEGKPQKAFFFDQVKSNNFDDNAYQLRFYSRVADENHDILYTGSRNSTIETSGRGNVDRMKPSTAYMEIPHISSQITQSFTAELLNRHKEEGKIGDNVFPEKVRALELVQNEQPDRLSTDRSVLEMSDVILGIKADDRDSGMNHLTSFEVVNDRTIPKDKNLRIYFEVYHLSETPQGANTFKVEYQVRPRNRNFFQRLFGKKENEVGLILNFESPDSFYECDLEIVTSSFEEGKYELSLTVIEPATGREKSKKLDFEIVR